MFYKVIDLIKFVIEAAGVKMSNEELNNYLVDFQLKGMEKKFATSLSGGQKQRLNILLAIINKPKLLLLDEVSTGLDVESRIELKKFIKDYLEESKASLILVSHNPDEIKYLTNRVIVLEDGLIFEDQSMTEILKKYKNFDAYIDDLFMNRFKAEKIRREAELASTMDLKNK
jgi:ABC-2 type transport system ATP-binding protein